jgi:rubrerythrin
MSNQRAKTSYEWWAAIKSDPALLEDWLRKQYRGEVTAVSRLEQFLERYVKADNHWYKTLRLIQEQERQHAAWIEGLLLSHGFSTEVLQTPQRYWEQTLNHATDFHRAAAASAYAEKMRLERIRLIATDPDPANVREVFERILPQEIFHARAFRRMAGEAAMADLLTYHEAGVEAIGLIPTDAQIV